MSSTDNPQQVSRGLLITLGVVVGLAALYALWVFVVAPLLADDPADDPVAGDPPDAEAEVDVDPDADADASEGPVDDADDGVAPIDPDLEGGNAGEVPGVPTDELLDGTDVVPETFEIFTARDPFQQLVVEAPAADTPGTGTGGGTDGDGTDGGGTDGGGTTGGGTDDGGSTGGGTGGGMGGSGGTGGETAPDSAEVGSTTVALDDVFIGDDGEPRLLVTVNGTTYEVREGDVFAERFRALTVEGVCATFLFGDSRFTLCEGESIVK